jgi:formylglycine-generating enzyme required for sulfatase activity
VAHGKSTSDLSRRAALKFAAGLVATALVIGLEMSRVAQGAAPAPYTESIPNTKVVFEMVPIPAGTFTMGSPSSEAGRSDDEGPAHPVTLKAFYIGAKEVSWDEYDEFAFSQDLLRKRKLGLTMPADAADAMSRPTPPYADESWGWGKEKQPVIGITQYAAVHYCQWLSARTGKHYRLPTEAEWEYAARAGTTTAYSFGDDMSKAEVYAWLRSNAGEQPHVGGLKPPNAWGLFDMHGNVAEWTGDKYDAAYYATAPKTNPFDDPGAALYPHAVRGGSWDDDAPRLRSAARRTSMEAWSRRDPQNPKSLWWHTDATFVGFRVVAEMDNPPR